MSRLQSGSDENTRMEKYGNWLPNQWTESEGVSEVGGNVSGSNDTSIYPYAGKFSLSRTNLLSSINFPDLFSGLLNNLHIPKMDKGKVLSEMRFGPENFGGGREVIVCPVNILSVCPMLRDEISTGESCLEVDRSLREFLLRFKQVDVAEGEENPVEFFYSDLDGIPECKEDEKIMKFLFKEEGKDDVKSIEVQFSSQNQYEHLKKGFERYEMILKSDSGRYDKEVMEKLDDISYNRGGKDFGAEKFYKKPARQWTSKEIEEWLQEIPFQERGRGRIFNVHEYMGKYRKYPSDEKKTQRDPKGADYTQLSYDKLIEYFEKREGEGGKLVKTPETYLDRLFEKDEELYQTIQFEVKMMECNSAKKNEPYYNYNFNQVLKKIYSASDPSNLPSLTQLRNELLIEKRYLWSVMDNVDHFLSLLLFKEGVEDFIERKTRQFEEEGKIVEFTKRSNDDWYDWASKLHKFNNANHIILEEMNFRIRKEYEFFLTVVVKMTWLKTLMTKKTNLKDKFLEELVEKERKENENISNPTLKYTNPKIHQACVDTLTEIAEGESKLSDAKKKSNKWKKRVILDLWKSANKHKKMLSRKSKKGAVEEDEETKRKRFQEENEFLISAHRRRIIQKFLVHVISSFAKVRMFDLCVKTVLSFASSAISDMFEISQAHVQIVNVALYWFSNGLIYMTDLKACEDMYEDVIAIDASCPTMVFKNLQSVYDQILEVSKFIVTCNTEYKYSKFTVPLHKQKQFGRKVKEDTHVNCQVVTQRLLKRLNYTQYDEIVNQFLEEFFEKMTKKMFKKKKKKSIFSLLGRKTSREETERKEISRNNLRWIPLRDREGDFSEIGRLFAFDRDKDNQRAPQIFDFLQVRHNDYKFSDDDCVWESQATPRQLFLNSRKDVCELVNMLLEKVPNFRYRFPGVYQLLKGFDRAFQILRRDCENCEDEESQVKHPFGSKGDSSDTEKSVDQFSSVVDLYYVFIRATEQEQKEYERLERERKEKLEKEIRRFLKNVAGLDIKNEESGETVGAVAEKWITENPDKVVQNLFVEATTRHDLEKKLSERSSRVEELEEIEKGLRSDLERERDRVKELADENQKTLDGVLDSVGKRFRIKHDCLHIHRDGKLGKGGFGSVFLADWTNEQGEKKVVAVKAISYGANSDEYLDVFKEFSRSLQFDHENVIKTFGFDDSRRNEIAIVMEKLDGNMHDYVRENVLTMEEKLDIMMKMTKGIRYLHSMKPNPFLHRDIKGENFLYKLEGEGEDRDIEVKVCDFGLAKAVMDGSRQTQVSCMGQGTAPFMPPEAGKGHYSVKSDVYSLGIAFWEVLFEEYPYEGRDPTHVFTDVVRNGLRPDLNMYGKKKREEKKEEEEEEEEDEGEEEEGSGYLPQVMEEFIKRCWDADRNKRPSIQEILLWFDDNMMEILAIFSEEEGHFPPLAIQEKTKKENEEKKNKEIEEKKKIKEENDT